MKEWKISGIGTLAYEYEDGELLQVYSEASLHAYLEGIASEEGVSEERKWLEEGLALLKGAQKSFDEVLEELHEAAKGAIGMPHKEIETMLRDSKKKKERKRRDLSEKLALEELSEMVDSKGSFSDSVRVSTNLGDVLKVHKDDVCHPEEDNES